MTQRPDSPIDLAVNISARQLVSASFVSTVAAVLTATDTDPGALILELTETIFMHEDGRAAAALSELKKLGLRIALDDFGSGYSSLTYLARLSLDFVKIDRGFIANIGHDPTNRAIVVAIVNLAHNLGLAVVADGVEHYSQRDEVAELECEFAQGPYYAAAVPASEITSLIGAQLGWARRRAAS
jgi:EAL domain-containing protein (putative c-di-GMP-specific phosphodiesterase class I)